METDFTSMNKLRITICGEPFPHLLCHSVLTYSNWEWGVVSHSESLLALKKGFQTAVSRLGRVPKEHWTDHSTAATHVIGRSREGDWQFNQSYLDMMEHFGVKPKTIQVGQPHENGDVESINGALKRRIEQHLLLRGSRDFGSLEEYVTFIEGVMEKANRLRQKRLAEELAVMRLLDVRLLPEYDEEDVRVMPWSTVQVSRNTYSVPSRLRGEKVKARVYEDHIELYYHGVRQLTTPRLLGEGKHAINYRDVIDSLLRKPGAFLHYKYHQDMFPTEEFRWAYDTLCEACSERMADMEYLRILQEAARTMESRVQKALGQLRALRIVPRWSAVVEFAPGPRPQLPELLKLQVNLSEYDHLLERKEVTA
jgi:transposase InsO family protein